MVGSNPMTGVLIRRGEYHVTTEEGHMTPEAGVGVTPRMDSHHQKLEEARKDFFSGAFRGTITPLTP